MTEPSTAELLRRLEDVVKSVERLSTTMEASYVRRDVYEARHEALRSRVDSEIKDIEDDVAAQRAKLEKGEDRWKQAMFTFGGSLLLMLIPAAFAVSNFLARTGG